MEIESSEINRIKSQKTTIDGKAVLLDKGNFRAKFTVTARATDPSSGLPDIFSEYIGSGSFQNTNAKWKAE